MADTVSELGDNYDTSNIISRDGERLTIALDQGSNTATPSMPLLYNDEGYQIAYWDESEGEWLSSDFAPTGAFGKSDNFNEWLVNNSSDLRWQTISSIATNLTEEERKRYENNTVFGEYNTFTNTKGSSEQQATTYTVQGVSKPKPGTLWGEKAFSQRSRTLIYPEDHSSENFDFIKITPIEYVPAISQESSGFNTATEPPKQATLDVGSDDWFGFKSLNSRYLRVKQVGSTMFLPMTPDISENNAVDWGGDKANALQAAAGKVAFDTIGRLGTAGDFQGVGQALVDSGNQIGATANAFINNPQIGNFIKAYFAGKAVNANILGRAGIVVNPNLEVLFNGPALRTFAYNFRFTPRTESEATTVRTIIKVLKKTMAPKRRGKVFLTPPAVYRLKYIFNSEDDDHPFLNKIKPCALTGFNVQYAPDGNYMTYDDGSMTSYNVQMNFSELEPIYNDDIDDVDDRTTGF